MRSSTIGLFGFAFVLVAAATAPAFADDSITLHQHKSVAGEKWTEEKSEATNLTVEVKGAKHTVVGAKASKKSVEITKVEKDRATEAKVTYGAITESEKIDGKDKPKPASPVANKGYKLTIGTALTVEGVAGKASADEIALVQKLEKRFLKPDGLDKVLDGKTFKKGTAVALPSDELAKAFADDETFQKAALSLTYTGTTGAIANFDMTMKLEGDKSGAHLVMDVKGSVTVDTKTYQLLDMKMKGTIKSTGGQAPADGTIELAEHTTH